MAYDGELKIGEINGGEGDGGGFGLGFEDGLDEGGDVGPDTGGARAEGDDGDGFGHDGRW